ncbi:MAG: FitA-like ribbon-helix-helix domain-containing protein [Rhizomicrobium sp.]
MASITIRNLDDGVKKSLRKQAAENGRSVEAEARAILGAGVKTKPRAQEETGADIFDSIHRRFAPFGGLDLQEPVRRGRRVPTFK